MRDLKTEAFLDRGKWTYTYEGNITFDQIDVKFSEDNPARLHRKIDEDRVLQYAEEMQDGEEFPAIVLLTPSERGIFQYDVATGMHRLKAADCAQRENPKHIDAYIVNEPGRYRRDVLIRMLNVIEGVGVSQPEQIMHILYLHETYKEALPKLSKEWHQPIETVRTHFRAEQARHRARKVGYDLSRMKISMATLGKLNSIHSDVVFQDAIHFVVNHAPSAAKIEDLCHGIKDCHDEQKARDLVHGFIAADHERRERERAKIGRTRQVQAQLMISNATRFNRQLDKGIEHLHLDALAAMDTRKCRANMEDLITNAKRILVELDRLDEARNTRHAA